MTSEIKVHTSYYAGVRNLPYGKVVFVQVSNTTPDWFDKPLCRLSQNVFPDWSIINQYKSGAISYEAFSERYRETLDTICDRKKLIDELEQLAEERNCTNVVLLCWEKDDKQCHRSVLGEWLKIDNFKGEL